MMHNLVVAVVRGMRHQGVAHRVRAAVGAATTASSGSATPIRADARRCFTEGPVMPESELTDAFLLDIPKTDLHVHLDGSLRLSTVIELAKQEGVELPAYTEEGLCEAVFKDHFASLEEYLECFRYTSGVMQTRETLARVAYEFAQDNYHEGVRYFEVRFAPQLHASSKLDMGEVLEAVNEGLHQATVEANGARSSAGPPFKYGIIVCALKLVLPVMSNYYADLCTSMDGQSQDDIIKTASNAAATAAVEARNANIPVVAFDLAGPEAGFPNKTHAEACSIAKHNFLNRTIHAGESYGPESIKQAFVDCDAERIGHGYNLFNPHAVASDSGIEDPEAYTAVLQDHAAQRRIPMEVCLKSNQDTMPWLRDKLAMHTLGQMIANHVPVTINTDNRLVSKTTTVQELRRAVQAFSLSPSQLRTIVMAGFEHSFFPGSYDDKLAYAAAARAAYDEVERSHGITAR